MKPKGTIDYSPLCPEKKARLIQVLADCGNILNNKTVTLGFDGFIDSVARVIREKKDGQPALLFNNIEEFGDYILSKKGASFSLELHEQKLKLGGNMPITANAMGKFYVNVNCIGALGYPGIHPLFDFSSACRLYSFASPGTSTALEFSDGKMMIADMGALNSTGWEEIKRVIGYEKLQHLYEESDLVCLLNWSEIDTSTNTWKGLLNDIFPLLTPKKKRIVFVDLSDCSKRSDKAVIEALGLLSQFGKYANVILSLNRNEANVIYRLLYQKELENLHAAGNKIFTKLNIDTLVIHTAKETVACIGGKQAFAETFYTDNPVISTGAGDNFNAGFCVAQLLQLELEDSLFLANAFSGYYVRNGISGLSQDLITFIETI